MDPLLRWLMDPLLRWLMDPLLRWLIEDDAGLLRRIHPIQIVNDQNKKVRRPSSAAFLDSGLFVDAEPVLHAFGFIWEFSLRGFSGYSLVRFAAADARAKRLSVVHDPLPDNNAHTVVTGKKTRGIANHLRDASEWVYLEPEAP
jgi:hypothetical protein